MKKNAENSIQQSLLNDSFGRRINYLRVSITDRCNLRCKYCVSHTPSPKLSHNEILRYEEILKIIRVGARYGITKVRITGGEPLARRGIYDFLDELSSIPGLDDISLTTNGVLLQDNLPRILGAGIKRLNISIDSLKKERFRQITGFDKYESVWNAALAALEAGIYPVKLNVVAIPGVNDDEIADFARLTLQYPFFVRFIEYMPIGSPELQIKKQLLTPEIEKRVASVGKLLPVELGLNDGPARRFRFSGAKGEIGFISPVSNHFCSTCNRMRLTASGKLRACLLSDTTIDIAGALRKGCSDEELYNKFLQATLQKGEKHSLKDSASPKPMVEDHMFSIGG